MTELEMAQNDAVNEIVIALLGVCRDGLKRHGNDPDNFAIIGTAISEVVDRITRVDPTFRRVMIGVLTLMEASRGHA